jgi:hypothetical protein
MYEAFYSGVYNSIAKRDSFQGGTSDAGAVIAAGIAVLVLIVIQLFVVQFLWNAVLVPTVSVVRPLKTLLQTLGLLILLALIVPGSVVVA